MTAPAQEQSVVCPQCGQDNLPGTAFCDNCGAELPMPQPVESVAAPARRQQPVESVPAPSSTPQPMQTTPAPPMMAPIPTNGNEGASFAAAPPAPPAPIAAASMPNSTSVGTLRCQNCGTELPANAKFCLECGTRVPPPPPQMVRPTHCQNCGTELLPNARFCMECGTKVELVPADQVRDNAVIAMAPPPQAPPQQAVAAPPTNEQQAVADQPAQVAAPPVPEQAAPPMPAAPADTQAEALPAQAPEPLPMPITQQQPVVTLPPFLEDEPAPAAQPPRAPRPQPLPRLMFGDGQALAVPHAGEVLIGRSDPVSGITPDLDLTPFGGEAAGVSRRHAVLQPAPDGWQLIDLDSTNATRRNNQRLTPNTPTPVQPGDTLRFGRLEVTFEQPQAEDGRDDDQGTMNAAPTPDVANQPVAEQQSAPMEQPSASRNFARVYDAPDVSAASSTSAEAAPTPANTQSAPTMVAQIAPAPLPPFLEDEPAPAPAMAEPAQPVAQAQPHRALPRLMFGDGQALAVPHAGEVLIGRSDPVSGITPDLDLTPFGGEAAGVSRRHAVLQPAPDGWQLIDLDSTNATRRNNQRLTPNTPTPVTSGDTLRFGRLEVIFQA